MKKKAIALALCLSMVFGLTACGGSKTAQQPAQSNAEAQSNTVALAMGNGFSALDPGYVYEKYPNLVVNACYQTLFKFNEPDGKAEPNLVDTYEFSEDGLTLTCVLKDGIVFASGNPMTSADVAFSLMRTKNLKGNPSFLGASIESIDTPDEKTVVMNLNQVDSALVSKLTFSAMAILDSEVVKANGGTDAEDAASTDTAQDYLNSTSAGSGMYIMTSYVPDDEIILEKNPNFWGEATNVDKYIIKIQPDANTQMMTLASGDIDIALNLTDDTLKELSTKENIAIEDACTKTTAFVLMNMDPAIGGPVSNPQVQQAIRKALDYEGIRTICGEGAVTPYSIIQDGFLGSLGLKADDYRNVEEAKQLMADAGYADGFSIDLQVSNLDMEGIALTDLAQKVKADLAEIGIDCNIVTTAWGAGYGDLYRQGKLNFTVMYWGTDYLDPNVQLEFLPGGVVGLRAGWTADMNPELAAMFKKTMEATNDDDRAAILGEIQEATANYGPFAMLAQAPTHLAYNTRLTGVRFFNAYNVDLTQVNVK